MSIGTCNCEGTQHRPPCAIAVEWENLRTRVAELEERLAYWESVWKGEIEWAWEDVKKHEARVAELEGAADKLSRDIFTKVGETNDAHARIAALEGALRRLLDRDLTNLSVDPDFGEDVERARAALASGGPPCRGGLHTADETGSRCVVCGLAEFNAARPAPAPAPCSCCADHKRDVGGHHPLCECLSRRRAARRSEPRCRRAPRPARVHVPLWGML